MTTLTHTSRRRVSGVSVWTGRILSGLIVLFMLFDGVTKIMQIPAVVEAFQQLGYPAHTIRGIGIAALVGAIVYAIPQTSVLGAIILTGFFGGALATQVRADQPLFNDAFVVVFGIVTWLGLYLRDPRVRELAPVRRPISEIPDAAAHF